MTLGKGHQKVYGIDRPLKITYSHVHDLTETIPPPKKTTTKHTHTHTTTTTKTTTTKQPALMFSNFSHHEIRKNVKLASTEHRASTIAICSHVKGLTLIKQKLTEKYYFRFLLLLLFVFSLSLSLSLSLKVIQNTSGFIHLRTLFFYWKLPFFYYNKKISWYFDPIPCQGVWSEKPQGVVSNRNFWEQ